MDSLTLLYDCKTKVLQRFFIAKNNKQKHRFLHVPRFESDNEVNIYISNINFEATYSYIEGTNVHLSMIRVYAINSITTQDIEMCKSLKEWIQSLKKFSTLISVSGEMQRIQFFQKQREIIDTL